MVDEIAGEYQFGSDIGELHILNFAYVINKVFTVPLFFSVFNILDLTDFIKQYFVFL